MALSTTLATNAIINRQTDPVGLLLVPGPGLNWSGLIAGSGDSGVRVTGLLGAERFSEGQLVSAAGSLSLETSGAQLLPLLRVADPADIQGL